MSHIVITVVNKQYIKGGEFNMNFTIENGTIHNNCDGGKCCAKCQYVSKKQGQWEACSDSCFDNSIIKEFGCTQCKHKPDYII